MKFLYLLFTCFLCIPIYGFDRSENYQKILINEIVTDPQIDYSGGGWTGKPGLNNPGPSDDWIELVNRTDSMIVITDFYILQKTKSSQSVKKITVRRNPGMEEQMQSISNYSYAVASIENGLANEAYIALFDGHPDSNGKIIDELEYGNGNITGNGDSAPGGNAISFEDEAIARIPNAVPSSNPGKLFKKQKATFGNDNGNIYGNLFASDVTGSKTSFIFLSDPDNTDLTAEIYIKNDSDTEILPLTNYGIYFCSALPVEFSSAREHDGILQAQNGAMNTVYYGDFTSGRTVYTSFIAVKEGWNVPKNEINPDNVLVYPNPIRQNEFTTIVFANLPEKISIRVMDLYGNILKELNKPINGAIIWKASFKKGIYIAVFQLENHVISKKLLVQ